MQLKKLFCLFITIIIVASYSFSAFGLPGSSAEKAPDIDAASAILTEPLRGQTLYSKNPSQRLHVSSASKIMTAIIVIERAKLDAKIAISKESVDVTGSMLNLEAGEKFTVEDLLYAVLLTPANDAANALAEFAGGDADKFVSMMNSKAKELNMENTLFKNVTGLFDKDQYTTAQDISLLMSHALKNPEFSRIFSSKGKVFNSGVLVNHNKLFWEYEGVDGGKAGYNDKNKQSAITTAKKGNQRFLCIILDSPENSVWSDSSKIFDYAFDNFKTDVLVEKGQKLHSITISDTPLNLVSQEEVLYTYPIGESNIRDVEFHLNNDLRLPLLKTQSVGTAKYILEDETIINISLYPQEDTGESKKTVSYIWGKLTEHKDLLYLVVILIIIEFLLIIKSLVGFIKRRTSLKEKREDT
ncbi:D-alanyl-D-alanine carboxypeptidase/D-alanyl-D-alanine carboxypeptidase (penicillin-binding protein 5/6) [Anaerobacterium chartisolvens]|uniref:serine-type D-Ala-D-Ala carboxypeptidase n=1 Tax=Anaerobacterium chartisolvens TaxID=1297424 RepID=A0A369B8L5_9FIRM|nr:D-alanyl-D-alanine carboxypeptidase family protein [Anaerobacterium chartisolvens]RCX17863.1 D-alanyl-D-alanine carboxypeptidase/D-alanyl-D-alanine carboxypeptidase (penicillin-binding protein 5/6) [Anaerobacterium chartisolvens]